MDNESKKEGRILRLPAVMARTGLSRSTIYNYINQSLFPHSVRLGPHSVGWLAHDVDEWIETRVKTSRAQEDRGQA